MSSQAGFYEKVVGALGRVGYRLLIAGFALSLVGRIVESKVVAIAALGSSIAGAVAGASWLSGRLLLLRREGNLCLAETYATMGLWSLTPWGLYTTARQLSGELRWRVSRVNRGSGEADPVVRPPFLGCWLVVNGGVSREDSHSWGLVSQRYAYDLIRVEDSERLERQCRYRKLEDWATYGSPVVAAADGLVVKAVDGVRDNEPVGRILLTSRSLAGNYVVVRHGEGLYSLYAHLKRGSVAVEEGEELKAGDLIGEAGNSGMSTAPHLHFQLMTTQDPLATISLPFKVASKDGESSPTRGYPRRGTILCGENQE